MKKQLVYIIASAVTASLLLTACLKDNGFDKHQYGIKDPAGSEVGVGFPQAANAVNVSAMELRNTSQQINLALVNLLSDEPAEKDIRINLQVHQGLVNDYNAANDPDLEVLPQNTYTIPSLTVVIHKGQRTGMVTLTIPDATVFNPSKRYGIGFTINSVDAADVVIAQNLKNVLFAITIRNIYEGRYEIAVNLTGHPSASGRYEETGTLTTVDANTLDAPLAVAQVFASSSRLSIKINPDNTLTLSSNATTINPHAPDKNYYDPVTRTFHFNYTWGAGPRNIIGTARRL